MACLSSGVLYHYTTLVLMDTSKWLRCLWRQGQMWTQWIYGSLHHFTRLHPSLGWRCAPSFSRTVLTPPSLTAMQSRPLMLHPPGSSKTDSHVSIFSKHFLQEKYFIQINSSVPGGWMSSQNVYFNLLSFFSWNTTL